MRPSFRMNISRGCCHVTTGRNGRAVDSFHNGQDICKALPKCTLRHLSIKHVPWEARMVNCPQLIEHNKPALSLETARYSPGRTDATYLSSGQQSPARAYG